MGDAEGQSGVRPFVIFLDENHCRNPYLITSIEEAGLRCEKHLDHFTSGLEDIEWLPIVALKGWALLTTDARIRTNGVEKEAVRANGLRMFYFSRNNLAGREMGTALKVALPKMLRIFQTQLPPFTASITKSGEVTVRDTFTS